LRLISKDKNMTEERISQTRTPEGNTHTTTTIVSDGKNSGGSSKFVILLILVFLAAGALFVFSQMSDSETAKDAAVGEAAQNVGKAAEQVGDAAEDAIDEVAD
jgi:flagellar basal body-associated protein FliL